MQNANPGWQSRPLPEPKILSGRYVRLEPLSAAAHSEDLYRAASAPGQPERFRYLLGEPPASLEEMKLWAARGEQSRDPLLFAVVEPEQGRALGRHALMRIEPEHGVIEIGNIFWGPELARSRLATEAFFLTAEYVFSLGYRRFEWKCNDDNQPSKNAALRFGFSYEGLFRQHMVVKGRNRDTAWYSIIDSEWPKLRPGFERWLQPENFDAAGQQITRLSFAG